MLKHYLLPEPPPDIGKVSSDPDEVDLSSHPSAIKPNNSQQHSGGEHANPSEADLRALLGTQAPSSGTEGAGVPSQEDPMMKMLSQLMGGIPGGEDGAGNPSDGGLPPGLAAMLGAGGMAGAGGNLPEQRQDTYGYLWRIIHAISALCLGLYVASTSMSFGPAIERGNLKAGLQGPPNVEGPNLFFVFTTVELILQSSRLYLEKGNVGRKPKGWIGLVAGFLPEPYRGYVILIGRYARIWGTAVEDAMVILFVVGCIAWYKSIVR